MKNVQLKTTQSGARGMTLLEVIMAVAMISIALTGTLSAWINSQRLQTLQREESLVQAAMQRYINDIRAVPFTQVDNDMTPSLPAAPTATYQGGIFTTSRGQEGPPEIWSGQGYSGGDYPGFSNRKLPGKIKLFLGWNGMGIPTDDSLRGVKVSPNFFPGSIKYGNSYWAPQAGTPELRIIFINNEVPTEAQFGEDPANFGDGVDLNADGQISSAPVSSTDPVIANAVRIEFGDVDSQPLFPRYLATPIGTNRAYVNGYQNAANMIVYPVVLQARWWSVAGLPREITLITFLTNRSGTGL